MPSVTGALVREVLLLHAWCRGSWHGPRQRQRVEVHVEDQLGLEFHLGNTETAGMGKARQGKARWMAEETTTSFVWFFDFELMEPEYVFSSEGKL